MNGDDELLNRISPTFLRIQEGMVGLRGNFIAVVNKKEMVKEKRKRRGARKYATSHF